MIFWLIVCPLGLLMLGIIVARIARRLRPSIFDISGANRNNPVFLTQVNAGLNPFGILGVPAVPEPTAAGMVAALAVALAARRRNR